MTTTAKHKKLLYKKPKKQKWFGNYKSEAKRTPRYNKHNGNDKQIQCLGCKRFFEVQWKDPVFVCVTCRNSGFVAPKKKKSAKRSDPFWYEESLGPKLWTIDPTWKPRPPEILPWE